MMDYNYLRESLAAAMRAVHAAPEYPGVTIGTTPSPNPSYQLVEYFGNINDTHYGYTFFEADRLLKSYSLGKDNLHPTDPFTSGVAGYVSFFDRYLALKDTTPTPVSQRFWFSPTLNLRTVPGTPYGIVFSNTKVNLLWAYLPGSGASTKAAQAANNFVNHFNTHYYDFAAEQAARGNPTLHELVQLFKLFGIAHWTLTDTVQLNLAGASGPWLNSYPIASQNTPDTTPTISRTGQFTSGNIVYTIAISGGVATEPPNTKPDPVAKIVIDEALNDRPSSGVYAYEMGPVSDVNPTDINEVTDQSQELVALVFPLSRNYISNGSFEGGPASLPWVQSSSGFFQLIASGAGRSGTYGAYLADYANADDAISQQVTIPATANRPMLVYHWLMFSNEPLNLTNLSTTPSSPNLPPFITLRPVELWNPISLPFRSSATASLDPSSDNITVAAANDFLYVQILDTGNNVLQTLQTLSNNNIRNQWQAQGFSLDAYKGQTIRIRFRATNNGTNHTGFLVDDVSLDTATNIQPPSCTSTITSTFLPIILKTTQ
jgi:hypothetical protein